MNIFQIVVITLTIVSGICAYERSTTEELQDVSLNEGEYFPSERYNSQHGHKFSSRYSPEQQEGMQYTIIKRIKEVPFTKKIKIERRVSSDITPILPYPKNVAYAAVHQTKILPVKVVKEGPVKHVYLPEYYSDQSKSRTSRFFDNFNQVSYNPYQYNLGQYQYQQNYVKPSLQYNLLPIGINQGALGHGYNTFASGYRVGKSNQITTLLPEYGNQYPSGYPIGFGNNLYGSGAQYMPQTFGYSSGTPQIPSYTSEYTNTYQQLPQPQLTIGGQQNYVSDVSDQYKSFVSSATANNDYISNQYGQTQDLTSTLANNMADTQQSNSDREAKLSQDSGLDPELASLVNDVLSGKGTTTQDGFTMIKSKTDNAIYLIGKPGMSLTTIPNFSAYNYDSFQKSEKTDETKTEEMKTT